MDHSRGDICSNIMKSNGKRSRVIIDNIMQRYAALLRALALEFLVGSKQEATEDLRQRLEDIGVQQIALLIYSEQE